MGAFDGLRDGQVSHGYWGKHTGSIDWCEENYAHTPYVAEFINTVTNVPEVLIGLYAAASTVAGGLHKRYALLYLGLSLIGVGSTGFHASLRWEWQLMDELPMIYVVSYASYLVWDTRRNFDLLFGIWGPLMVIAWCIFVTFSYICLPNPIYHQVAFAFILLSAVGRNVILLGRIPAGHPARRIIGWTLLKGSAIFALGFAIWNVDNIFCNELRSLRQTIHPLGFLLEGHAIWHLMTGYGTVLIFAAAIYLSLSIKVSPDAYTFNPNAFIPLVRPVPQVNPPTTVSEKSTPATTGKGHAPESKKRSKVVGK